jgi:endo-1,3(4)-beta-glucanase
MLIAHLGKTEKPLFHYQNHPIKWVRVTGVIVAVDEYPGKNVYTVDDSSGMCVECVCVAPVRVPKMGTIGVPTHLDQIASINQTASSISESKKQKGMAEGERKGNGGDKTAPSVEEPIVPWDLMDVGTVIKVKGRIGDFWKQRQVEVVKVEVLWSTDQEVKCWNEVMDFRRDVLGKHWVVSRAEEEKCRRARERELRGKGKKARDKGKDREEKRKEERDEVRRKRKEIERREEEAKRRKERNEAMNAQNKVNYPSLAARRAAAGKYDALGI